MSVPIERQGPFFAAVHETRAYVRVVGLATMADCPGLQRFIDDARGARVREFVFDFGACDGFDSTFMGTLVGIVLETGARDAARARVCLINLADAQRRTLAEVGVDRLVEVVAAKLPAPPVELPALGAGPDRSVETRLRRVVSAHENLLRVDPANAERFGDFLAMVEREIARGGRGGPPPRGGEAPKDGPSDGPKD